MTEAFESGESLEGFEFESESESESEAAPRRWAPPARASGGGLYRPRPSSNAVTQVQLQAAMSRVGDQLKRNSGAITTVNSRVNSVNASEKKDNEERKKDLKGIGEKIQLLAMLPLLVKPAGVSLGGGATLLDAQGIAIANPKVLTPTTDTLTALLPLLLLGGFGGSGGLGSSSDGGMDSTTMLVLALALSGALH